MKEDSKGIKKEAAKGASSTQGTDKAKSADADSPELIKYRLLGAVVTFVLLALFGPEVLDGSGRVQTNSIIEIPDRPDVPAPPILQPPAPKGTGFDEASVREAQQRLLAEKKQQAAKTPKPAEKKAGSDVDSTAESVAQPLPRKAPMLAENKPAWTLQLATFSQSKNAYALREKLTKAGFNTYSRLLKDSSGETKYQVFVGPELSKQRLLVVKKQIAKKLKLSDGIIKPYRP
ncbi:SPOR domain-containing protein [Litoribrevibacter euphylliae]|uniref:SPOR domain-containing protein n=1 Tax=Litoribrevibacter euphylliae TaxID=1834034 RepID=A0ABV7HAQ7_9GAMM